MPIDARIPLMGRQQDPNQFGNTLAQILKINELRRTGDREELKDQNTLEETNSLRDFIKSPQGPEDMKALGVRSPAAMLAYQKSQGGIAKDQAQTDKAKLEGEAKKLEIGIQLISSAVDDPTFEKARAEASKIGSVDGWPQRFDPRWKEQKLRAGMNVMDQFSLKLKEQDQASRLSDRDARLEIQQDRLGIAQGSAAESARHNRVIENREPPGPKQYEFDRTMEAAGYEPGSPEYIKAARIKANLEAPIGGGTPRGAPGGEPKPLTPGNAGKIQMLQQGYKDIEDARKLIFDESGELNRVDMGLARFPGGGVGENPRLVASKIENAISAKYRAETGAAGNPDEIKSLARRFLPSPLDTKVSAADKIDRLQEFMSGTLELSGFKASGGVTPNRSAQEQPAEPPADPVGGPAAAAMPAPTTPQERDMLPPGTRYTAPDGTIKVKR